MSIPCADRGVGLRFAIGTSASATSDLPELPPRANLWLRGLLARHLRTLDTVFNSSPNHQIPARCQARVSGRPRRCYQVA